MKKYRFLIGIEIHSRINSKRKIFSDSKVNKYNKFDLAIPGSMPTLNKTIVSKTLDFLQNFRGCFCKKIIFFRKMYYYPDIPKGYQITQKYIKKNCTVKFFINKILSYALIKNFHLEEDTAGIKYSNNNIFLQYQRLGIPILESVSFPCFKYENIIFFLKTFREYCIFEKYSRSRLEMGEYKFDINISVINDNKISNKVEIKNLNSYKSILNSLRYEMYRLIKRKIKYKETRSYTQIKNKTYFLRKKKRYIFLREFDLKKYKYKLKKKKRKIDIIINNSKSYIELIKNLKKKIFFVKKKKTLKKVCKKKNIIDNDLLKNIIKNTNIKKYNQKYINYIIGVYRKTNVIENFISFKKKIEYLMKERDSNP
ncbi:hypothetical protein ACT2CC_00310 [Candidatus Vidania fulgoroideorum]